MSACHQRFGTELLKNLNLKMKARTSNAFPSSLWGGWPRGGDRRARPGGVLFIQRSEDPTLARSLRSPSLPTERASTPVFDALWGRESEQAATVAIPQRRRFR